MPTIDRFKFSQEINFNGMPTWVGFEGSLDEGEDPKEGLRKAQKEITEYKDEEQKAYTQSKWGKPVAGVPDEVQDALNAINACEELEGENGLKHWWTKSKSNLILSTAYKAKEKQLQSL